MIAMALELYNEKHLAAVDRAIQVFMNETPVSVAWSGGKDSSVLLDLVLQAAILAKERGASPYILVTNGDTQIENPEIASYVERESEKIMMFAEKHGIRLDYHVASPRLNDGWAVKIIGGRALPSFPNNNSDCTTDWKILPMARLRKHLMSAISESTGQEVITMVGTRYSESVARGKNMAERGDSHEHATRNNAGDLIYPIIADFDTDDVWEWVGMTRSGLIDSYSDFNDLRRLYSDAAGGVCVVIADSISEGTKNTKSSSCGSRFGCITCVKVKEDKSLNNMIALDEKQYGYMKGASQLRDFLVKTQWDFDRRQWVGRTVDDHGLVAIRPDVYSPDMLLDLLRYALTIDHDERKASQEAGLVSPRFELVSLKSLVAIDALWSLQGFHKPFQAIKEFIDITEKGIRYDVPDVPQYDRQPMPQTRFLYTGDYEKMGFMSGLRDPLLEMVGEGSCKTTKILKNGKVVLDIETEATFNVDLESAVMALDFEADRLLEKNSRASDHRGLTEGYRWWVRMGVISLSPQQVSIHDGILKRTELKELMGIAGPNVTIESLSAKIIAQQAGITHQVGQGDSSTASQSFANLIDQIRLNHAQARTQVNDELISVPLAVDSLPVNQSIPVKQSIIETLEQMDLFDTFSPAY